MIVYLDTSALVPLLVSEPASSACGELWDAADKILTTRLSYVEAVAALAMAARMGRITEEELRAGRAILDELWAGIDIIEFDDALARAAADCATRHGLRGYDAVHCAAALAVRDSTMVAASGDGSLLEAWRVEGCQVRDTHAQQSPHGR